MIALAAGGLDAVARERGITDRDDDAGETSSGVCTDTLEGFCVYTLQGL